MEKKHERGFEEGRREQEQKKGSKEDSNRGRVEDIDGRDIVMEKKVAERVRTEEKRVVIEKRQQRGFEQGKSREQ